MNDASLTEKIDKVVRDHLAEIQLQATAAVQRAFVVTSTKVRRASASSIGPKPAKRRDPALVAELSEQLRACILAEPGELMTVYAARIGASVRELHRPMTMLRTAGKLRTTGARGYTRYFPMPAK